MAIFKLPTILSSNQLKVYNAKNLIIMRWACLATCICFCIVSSVFLSQGNAYLLTMRLSEHIDNQAEPIEDIVYVKTTKTASSTIRSIFHRYCDFHGIQCAPFASAISGSFYEHSHIANLMLAEQITNRSLVSIFGPHFYYNRALMRRFRPHALRVTSLRHPLTRLRSDFNYRKLSWRKFREFTDFAQYVSVCHRVVMDIDNYSDPSIANISHFGSCDFIRNQQVRFLSGRNNDNHDYDDWSKYNVAQANLRSDNFFILLTEKLDESIVMLAHRLHWFISDMLYLPLKQSHAKREQPLDKSIAAKISEMEAPDVQLYEDGKKIFQQQLAEVENEKWFVGGVKYFRALQQQLAAQCDLSDQPVEERYRRAARCYLYLMDEVEYLRKEQCERQRTHTWVFFYQQPTLNWDGTENYRVRCLPHAKANVFRSVPSALVGAHLDPPRPVVDALQ